MTMPKFIDFHPVIVILSNLSFQFIFKFFQGNYEEIQDEIQKKMHLRP